MILYKVLRYIILDEAIAVFFRIVRNNTRPRVRVHTNDGLFPSLRFPDTNVYECLEDGIPKWVAFDDDNFPISFHDTEDEALNAWLEYKREELVDPDDDL